MLYIEFAQGYYISENGEITTAMGKTIKPRLITGFYKAFIRGKYLSVAKILAESFLEGYNPKKHKIIYKDNDPSNITLSNIQLEKRFRGYTKVDEETALKAKKEFESGVKGKYIYPKLGISKVSFYQMLKEI